MKRPIPPDFQVSERMVELAREHGWPDPHKELDNFRDYHLAHGTKMVDWEAAFRLWLRNCVKFAADKGRRVVPCAPLPGIPVQKPVQPQLELTDEQLAENRRRVSGLLSGLVKEMGAK